MDKIFKLNLKKYFYKIWTTQYLNLIRIYSYKMWTDTIIKSYKNIVHGTNCHYHSLFIKIN